jgi:hypothetical protein
MRKTNMRYYPEYPSRSWHPILAPRAKPKNIKKYLLSSQTLTPFSSASINNCTAQSFVDTGQQ